MPYKFRRDCPICYKSNLLFLANHLREVHQLTSEERKPWLKAAVFSRLISLLMIVLYYPTHYASWNTTHSASRSEAEI